MSTEPKPIQTSRDWRSGHYGADKTAHYFDWPMMGSRKQAICGTRTNATYQHTSPVYYCRECLRRLHG